MAAPPTLGSERLAAFPVARIGRARVNESAMVDPARWPWQRRTRRRLPRRRPDPRKEPGLWNKVAGSLATRIGTRCFALYERPWPTGASGRKWPIRRCSVNRPPRRRKGWERSDRERTRGGFSRTQGDRGRRRQAPVRYADGGIDGRWRYGACWRRISTFPPIGSFGC